jgi:hypothetical protein
MALIVRGKEDMVVAFANTLPRKREVLEVCRGVRALVYSDGDSEAADTSGRPEKKPKRRRSRT